jgi:plasmid stabilization system protein ParE
MSRYVLSDEALLELDGIWEYIARDDASAASRWVGKLLEACEMLSHNPRAGRCHAEIVDKSILFWPVANYIILYRVFDDHIDIVAVTEGSRDIPSYLRRRP